MIESTDLDKTAADIRAAAEACGALILDTVVSAENLPTAAVRAADFGTLVAHLRPRLVYLIKTPFDAREEAQTLIATGGAKKFLSKWNARSGETCRCVVGVMADGVLHYVAETAGWFDEFEDEAEALADEQREAMRDELNRAQEAEARQADSEEKKRLAPIIKRLLADPRFLASKVSASKRLALAEALFPKLDRTTLRKAVDRAASELWLRESST
ncbi:hypothetical protein [Bosea thiooxidans]